MLRRWYYGLVDRWQRCRRGIHYTCRRCGACCSRRGSVFFTREELRQAATALGIGEGEFRARYVTAKLDSLYEIFTEDACPLLDPEGNCRIYAVRPEQCRSYPFWRSRLQYRAQRRQLKRECPGFGRGRYYSPEEIKRRIRGKNSEY